MQFARVRSGVAESYEEATVLAIDGSGRELYTSGNPDVVLFYRSAIKPFQALAAQRTGLTLPDEHLAVTCSSHGGWPVHLAIVRKILSDHGLSERDLQCPVSGPLSAGARDLSIARGGAGHSRLLHTCSGKHSGWLAACVQAGWETSTYLNRDHPLQRSIREIVYEMSGFDPEPLGIDGCGAPTLRGSVRSLAKAFIELDTNPELSNIARSTRRFGALVADNHRADGRLAMWWSGQQKFGAAGLMAMSHHGVAIVSKSHSGQSSVAVAAALAAAKRIGALSPAAEQALEPQIRPPVIGAGRTVGQLELIEA